MSTLEEEEIAMSNAQQKPTPTADGSIAAASSTSKAGDKKEDDVPQLGALEEDDEFEEFAEQGAFLSYAGPSCCLKKGMDARMLQSRCTVEGCCTRRPLSTLDSKLTHPLPVSPDRLVPVRDVPRPPSVGKVRSDRVRQRAHNNLASVGGQLGRRRRRGGVQQTAQVCYLLLSLALLSVLFSMTDVILSGSIGLSWRRRTVRRPCRPKWTSLPQTSPRLISSRHPHPSLSPGSHVRCSESDDAAEGHRGGLAMDVRTIGLVEVGWWYRSIGAYNVSENADNNGAGCVLRVWTTGEVVRKIGVDEPDAELAPT